VLAREAGTEERERAANELHEALSDRFADSELKVVRASDPVAGLLGEVRSADLIVLGGTDAGLIEQVLGYAIPLELADRTATPVITIYEMPAEPRRWLK